MDLKKNSIVFGLALGLIVPFLGYWIWYGIFELMTYMDVMNPTGFSQSWRNRTIALLAICMNIIPFQMYQKLRNDETMRGLVFPTVLLVIVWVVIYWDDIFGAV